MAPLPDRLAAPFAVPPAPPPRAARAVAGISAAFLAGPAPGALVPGIVPPGIPIVGAALLPDGPLEGRRVARDERYHFS